MADHHPALPPLQTATDSPRALAGVFQSGTPSIPFSRDGRRRRNSVPTVGSNTPSLTGCDADGIGGPSPSDITSAISRLSMSGNPSAAQLAAWTNPCLFHRRFGDAVNIEKVLEEMQNDEQLSHNRLMQTAASVREVSRQLQRRSTRQAVKAVMIVTKARDNTLVELTREVAQWLMATPRYGKDVGVNVYVDSKLRKSKRFDAPGLIAENHKFENMLKYWTPELCWASPELFDLVITLGGDGTVLFTSWLFQRIVPPVLAFSLGSLGFLTTFRFEDHKAHLDRIMGDSGMRVTMRMRFTCTVYRAAHTLPTTSNTQATSNALGIDEAKIEGETHEVLNELVIDRGPSSYISSLDLYANDSILTRINADGLILSTPTGSTAYSLSAGGSLMYPDIPAMLLTPICPHTLSFRPMILNDSMELKISIPATGRGNAFVSFDGKGRVELRRGDEVVVRASRYPFPTVLSQPMEWFDSISRTLRWNTRAADQKGWSGDVDEDEDFTGEGKQEYDIDFDDDDDDSVRDSGYSGGSSLA
ncbi:ATP-NAD kinase [Myriangium duriaei CBS 260.36]|uniref:ATP-NAD kinase n=1 Tax=Myriangium duriaei CBS 260.36 TaxID=1168546 RepID=A0A9P4MJT8_9PEZI|nr:ATP-NAD kinase [Myriangium duriaei CBS 260.36]